MGILGRGGNTRKVRRIGRLGRGKVDTGKGRRRGGFWHRRGEGRVRETRIWEMEGGRERGKLDGKYWKGSGEKSTEKGTGEGK